MAGLVRRRMCSRSAWSAACLVLNCFGAVPEMRVFSPSGSLTQARYRHRPSGSRRTGIGDILLASTTRPCIVQPCHKRRAVEEDSATEAPAGNLTAPGELVHRLAVDTQDLRDVVGGENVG